VVAGIELAPCLDHEVAGRVFTEHAGYCAQTVGSGPCAQCVKMDVDDGGPAGPSPPRRKPIRPSRGMQHRARPVSSSASCTANGHVMPM